MFFLLRRLTMALSPSTTVRMTSKLERMMVQTRKPPANWKLKTKSLMHPATAEELQWSRNLIPTPINKLTSELEIAATL